MSDRRAWLDERCRECRAAPGTRCRRDPWRRVPPATRMHVARGWRERSCPTCKASAGDPCRTPSGREASQVHSARLRPGRADLLWGATVWEELEQRGATMAVGPFSGRSGRGGSTATITLSRVGGEGLVDVERWSSRDELAYALERRCGIGSGRSPGSRSSAARSWAGENRTVVIVNRRQARRSAV